MQLCTTTTTATTTTTTIATTTATTATTTTTAWWIATLIEVEVFDKCNNNYNYMDCVVWALEGETMALFAT